MSYVTLVVAKEGGEGPKKQTNVSDFSGGIQSLMHTIPISICGNSFKCGASSGHYI